MSPLQVRLAGASISPVTMQASKFHASLKIAARWKFAIGTHTETQYVILFINGARHYARLEGLNSFARPSM